jgi:hypothetical protein
VRQHETEGVFGNRGLTRLWSDKAEVAPAKSAVSRESTNTVLVFLETEVSRCDQFVTKCDESDCDHHVIPLFQRFT